MANVQSNDQDRVLVTGAAGMLGSQIMLGVPDGADAVGTDLKAAPGVEADGTDLTDAAQVSELFEKHAVLFLEEFDYCQLPPVYPTGDHKQEKL